MHCGKTMLKSGGMLCVRQGALKLERRKPGPGHLRHARSLGNLLSTQEDSETEGSLSVFFLPPHQGPSSLLPSGFPSPMPVSPQGALKWDGDPTC